MHPLVAALVTLAVYLSEHVLMTRRYGMKSSLQRLLNPSASARTDIAFLAFYEIAFRYLSYVINFTCGAGVLFLAVSWTLSKAAWEGLLHPLIGPHPIVSAALLFVVSDFVLYFTHRALHSVPHLWNAHKLHHAALEMNIANGVRRPFTEVFFQELALLAVLFCLFGPKRPDIALVVLVAHRAIDLVQHSDLPWTYGWLGKVIASPRFHRLHHSADVQDQNQHFGDIFSLWDYLFGTVSDRYRKDPSVAGACEVGLGHCADSVPLNRGAGALLHATIPSHLAHALRLRLSAVEPATVRTQAAAPALES